jgi:hypothetical protein
MGSGLRFFSNGFIEPVKQIQELVRDRLVTDLPVKGFQFGIYGFLDHLPMAPNARRTL